MTKEVVKHRKDEKKKVFSYKNLEYNTMNTTTGATGS